MKNTQPENRSFLIRSLLAIPASCLLLTGCSSTGGDIVASKPAAAARMAYNQQQIARGDAVRQGFSKDEVLMAWGAPSTKAVHQTPGGTQEHWIYVKTYHGGQGGGYHGLPRGWKHTERGSRYDTDSYYPSPNTSQTLGGTSSTDVPVKRVVFEDERVVSHETVHHRTSES